MMYQPIQLARPVYQMVCDKRDEYARMNDFRQTPVGKHASNGKVIEYAIALLNWVDDNRDDDAVLSIMARFDFQSKINKVGRPWSIRKKIRAIHPVNLDIIMNKFRAQGIQDPTDEQVLEMWNSMDIGKDFGYAKSEREHKTKEVMADPTLAKLDAVTEKIHKEGKKSGKKE